MSFAEQAAEHWLIGGWEEQETGAVVKIRGVQPDGTALGSTGSSVDVQRKAEINVDGPRVRILNASGGVIEVTRQPDGVLSGTLTQLDGTVFPFSLTKMPPRDALIGTWEGSNNTPGGDDPNRILIIQLISGNLGSGLYGYKGKRLQGVGITIDRSGDKPSISFMLGNGTRVHLTLMNGKFLVGRYHLTTQSAGFGLRDWHISFGKVE